MEHMKVVDLKVLAKEGGLQGYSKLRKAELITFLQHNLQPTTAPSIRPPRPTRPPPLLLQMSAWEPRPTPQALPSVRLRPDRSRQSELLRHSQPLDSQNHLNPTS